MPDDKQQSIARRRLEEMEGQQAGVNMSTETDRPTREQRLEAALVRSITAINDWLNIYASDFCHEARVREAQARIMSGGGTLAYIADVQQQNREAITHNPTKEC